MCEIWDEHHASLVGLVSFPVYCKHNRTSVLLPHRTHLYINVFRSVKFHFTNSLACIFSQVPEDEQRVIYGMIQSNKF